MKPIDIMVALENNNIEARPVWKPMHMQPFYEKYEFCSHNEEVNDVVELVAATKVDSLNNAINPNVEQSNRKTLSVSEDIFNRGVCLPSDTKMSDEDMARVVKIIKGLWG